MTHPGWFDADLAYSRYGRQREIEMAGLGGAAARGGVAALGIRLQHFGQLRRGPDAPVAVCAFCSASTSAAPPWRPALVTPRARSCVEERVPT